ASGDFENKIFIEEGGSRLEFAEIYAEYVAYDITDPILPVRVMVNRTGGSMAISPGSTGRASKLLVQQNTDVVQVNLMEKVRFRNVLQQPADYIIISDRLLRQPSSNYGDPVTAYAAYRASAAGGSF